MLTGKTIVLGVSGGIAAYKAVEIVSRLVKQGAEVHVIMTDSATRFVTPMTFREISGQPVHISMWEEPKLWNVEHIALARRADMLVIAPATANVLAKIAHGIADDFLSTTVLASSKPILLVPAMNTDMFLNPATQDNLKILTKRGFLIMQPATGVLACGAEGIGRLPEPVDIVERIALHFNQAKSLKGIRILVTAGGTREAIDPVRYIGNRSSGKMGYAIAAAAFERGAAVTLVSGPVGLSSPCGVKLILVESARQMREAVLAEFPETDIVIKAAAVADYRPETTAAHKIKKTSDVMTVNLTKNPDILAELGKMKDRQFLVGFAAETQELTTNAMDKLRRKNLDMLVANDVTLPGAGFEAETNIVKIFSQDGSIEELPQMEKTELARVLLDRFMLNYQQRSLPDQKSGRSDTI